MDVRATYRVQLDRGFTFDDAVRAADRLSAMGISHLYCSPYQESVPGSTHGYDVVDPTRVSTERGGEAGLRRMAAALRSLRMGHIVDIVPNHMASDLTHNHWWRDVLEHGQGSRWAPVFDIDWDHLEPRRRSQRIVLPVLGDHYGRVVDAGGLVLTRRGGELGVAYGDLVLPLSPPSAAALLARAGHDHESRQLTDLGEELEALVGCHHPDPEPIRVALGDALVAEPSLAAALDSHLAAVSADPLALHQVLHRQHYRLSYWRIAAQELDYRRFFDVNDLVAVRVEDPYVFGVTHSLIGRLLHEGILDGVRVDHVDGLRDPDAYLRQLRALLGPDAYLVVEKILGRREVLPPWPVEGTTGYDFAALTTGLFVDGSAEGALSELYGAFCGADIDFRAVAVESRAQVLSETLAADVNRLVDRLVDIRDDHYRAQDFTRRDLRDAVRALVFSMRVYRTYVRAGAAPRSDDIDTLEAAISEALSTGIDPELLAFLRDVLLRRLTGPMVTDVALRFQQLTGAVMAKGVEDTAFYRFGRLLALNEVGADPAAFGCSVEDFHRANQYRAQHWAAGMLATSTHDTKRGEDTRLRIAALSEAPDAWARAVQRWSELTAPHRRSVGPDRLDEYFVYQTLVGTWPISTDRLVAYVLKAAREAKRRTTWTTPDEAYEAALVGFVTAALDDEAFRSEVDEFVAGLAEAWQVASLSQTALRLTSPGVPDTYQGSETWDLSLVDPDNRGPVDHRLLDELTRDVDGAGPEEVTEHSAEGATKLWLTLRCLQCRARWPEAFSPTSTYRPLTTTGARAAHLVAFARRPAGDGEVPEVAVVVPRLVLGLDGDWGDTRVGLDPGPWTSELHGGQVVADDLGAAAGDLLDRFPVALLRHS